MERIRKGDIVNEKFQNHGITAIVLDIIDLDLTTTVAEIEFIYNGKTLKRTLDTSRLENLNNQQP